MRRQSTYSQGNSLKIVLYALGLVILAAIVFLMFHDIQAPTEHVSQEVAINIDD